MLQGHLQSDRQLRSPAQAIALVVLSLALMMLAGCRSSEPTGPSPFIPDPKSAGFVKNYDEMAKDPRYPFQKVWIDPEHVRKPRRAYIAPIDTTHMIHKPWFSAVNTRYAVADYQKDLRDIAQFSRDTIIREFRNSPDNKYPIVDRPEDAEVVLELSLVELIPAEPALVALGLAVPGPSLMNQPSVGFEGRVRLTDGNRVVMRVAFRDQPEIAVLDAQSLKSWYDANKVVITKWAKLIVQVANDQYDPKNRQLIPVTLLSW